MAKGNYKGSYRVTGDAGSGKTVVALHRAQYLASHIFTGANDRILVASYNTNLAEDLERQLRANCSPEAMARIDVKTIDSLAYAVYADKYGKPHIDEEKLNDAWEKAIKEFAPETMANKLSKQFYRDEYELVILPQNIKTEEEYKAAKRTGREVSLGQKERANIWPVFTAFFKNRKGAISYDDVRREAAEALERTPNKKFQYRAAVVDEMQDFSYFAFKLLRAVVEKGPNDIFLVGDARQRIYASGALTDAGIDIIGRGHAGRLNYYYRTTKQTFEYASKVLGESERGEGRSYCRAKIEGPEPQVFGLKDAEEEKAKIVEILENLEEQGVDLRNVCVAARGEKAVNSLRDAIKDAGIDCVKLGKQQPSKEVTGVRVATMHRVKGLEFDYVIAASVCAKYFPSSQAVKNVADFDPSTKKTVEKRERSLLYVALTRARKTAFITYYGKPSPYLPIE